MSLCRETLTGGKFGWGGTVVISKRNRPKMSSMRTEISCGLQGKKLILCVPDYGTS